MNDGRGGSFTLAFNPTFSVTYEVLVNVCSTLEAFPSPILGTLANSIKGKHRKMLTHNAITAEVRYDKSERGINVNV